MRVSKTIPLPNLNLVDCLTDDITVKLVNSNAHVDLITLDPESLGLVSRLSVDTIAHNFYSSCMDDSCIYIPTKLGQILALDKFSGDILTTINLGMPIMSDLVQDDQNIYCICGVPLGRKQNILFDNFCVCICDKETGTKKIQTSYFKGDPTFLDKNNDYLCVISGEHLIKYSSEGEFLNNVHLGPKFDYAIITEKYAICISSQGVVKAFNADNLEAISTTRAQPCSSKPFLVDEENLVWITPSGICHVNFKEKGFRSIEANRKMLSDSILSPDKTQLFAFDDIGNILSFNMDNHAIQSIKLAEGAVQKPVIVDDFLLAFSANNLHQLELK